MKEIRPGPVVTMYEFEPAPGIKVSRIASLADDLAMAMEALSVRIVAPIPGKAVVGIEMPNKKRETVFLQRDRRAGRVPEVAARSWRCASARTSRACPRQPNLAKMPHLLIAGTTGSGKSVAVNAMITSILYTATPEEVRFIMVDPKMLELSIYEGIPHLLLPVVTDPKKAALALRWAVEEMERRYELLAKSGVRDIASYNKMRPSRSRRGGGAGDACRGEASAGASWSWPTSPSGEPRRRSRSRRARRRADGRPTSTSRGRGALGQGGRGAGQPRPSAEPAARKLPYIVIVIDEFADLMMVAVARRSRPTWRAWRRRRAPPACTSSSPPSARRWTSSPASSRPTSPAASLPGARRSIDSRTIMGQPGAETLLGNGDMLILPPGTAH